MRDPGPDSGLLPLVDGRLVLAAAGFGAAIADALRRLTGGVPIIVAGASRSVSGATVTVEGTTTLLGATGVRASVVAAPGEGDATLMARFTLPDGWLFSTSFPSLPPFHAGANPTRDPAGLLDRLAPSRPALVITNIEGSDPVTGAPLVPGVNFAADVAPARLLGLLGGLVPVGTLPLSGPLRLPLPGETTSPLPTVPFPMMPWQASWPPPGIDLAATLGAATITDALKLDGVSLRVYSPTSAEWFAANPSYSPIVAGEATLLIPSAKISARVTMLGVLSPGQLTAIGAFEGLTLDKLADLADAAGAGDLADALPEDVRSKLASTVGKLSLQAIAVTLGAGFRLGSVALEVGIPDLDTEVLPNFKINSLSASFGILDPFGPGRALTTTLGGTVSLFEQPFTCELDLPEVAMRAGLAAPASIPLARVASYVGLDVPDTLPALSVEAMEFYADKAGNLGFRVAMAENPPWTIALGPVPLTIADVEASITRPAGGRASGRFGGTLIIGGVSLGISYSTPANFLIRSEFPSIALRGMAESLTGASLSFLPSAFDVTLTDNVVMIQKRGGDFVFLLATMVEGLGMVGFEARRTGAAWGFAFGLDLVAPRLSSLAGLGALAPFEDIFSMDELQVVVCSFDDPGFQFQPASAFDTPSLPPGSGVQLPTGGVIRGLNVNASWTLDTGRQDQKLLRDLLGLRTKLGIVLQVGADPAANSRLAVSIGTTLCKLPLTATFGGQIVGGDVSLFLAGTLKTTIDGRDQLWVIALQVLPNGVLFISQMVGTIEFSGVQLSNLVLIIGCDWEGIPSLGVAGALTYGAFHSSVAVFLNSDDPSQSLLAGSVSDLTLKDVVDAFVHVDAPADLDDVLKSIALKGQIAFKVAGSDADSLAKALDGLDVAGVSAAFVKQRVALPTSTAQVLLNVGIPGRTWFITNLADRMLHYTAARTYEGISVTLDPQLYLAPRAVVLASTTYGAGFYVGATLDLLGFEASATINIDASQGIAGDGALSRVVIGTEALFTLESSTGSGGAAVSVATFKQPTKPSPLDAPHVLIDGKVTILGLSRALYLSVSSSGFALAMKGTLIPGLSYDLAADVSGIAAMGTRGSLGVGLDPIDLGPLGTVDVGSLATVSADIGVQGDDMWARFATTFSFMGASYDERVSLDVSTGSLLDLPRKVADAIAAELRDLFESPLRWARAVAEGLVSGVDDIKSVLINVFNLPLAYAETILQTIGAIGGSCSMTSALLAA